MAGDRGSDVLDSEECHVEKDVGKGKQNVLLGRKNSLSTGPRIQKYEAFFGGGRLGQRVWLEGRMLCQVGV